MMLQKEARDKAARAPDITILNPEIVASQQIDACVLAGVNV